MVVLVVKAILIGRFLNSFVMYLFSLPMYVNLAHLREFVLPCLSCSSVHLFTLSSMSGRLYFFIPHDPFYCVVLVFFSCSFYMLVIHSVNRYLMAACLCSCG